MKKFNNYILFITCFAFAAIAAVDLTLPLYSDEVAVKFITTNFFASFGGYVNLLPQCDGPDGIDWIFYPAAALMSILFSGGPWLIKITSIAIGLYGLILILLIVRRSSNSDWKFQCAGLLSICLLGVVPFTILFSRPEQLLVLSIAFPIILILYSDAKSDYLKKSFKTALSAACVTIAFYTHPKAIFYFPVYSLIVYCIYRKIGAIYAIVALFVVLMSIYCVLTTNASAMSCGNAPIVKDILNSHFLQPSLLMKDPVQFVSGALGNLRDFPGRLIPHALLQSQYQSNWFPSFQFAGVLVDIINWAVYILLFVLVSFTNIWAVFLGVMRIRINSANLEILFAAFLAFSNILNASIYTHQNFYSLSQFVLLSLIVFVLIVRDCFGRFSIVLRSYFLFSILISLISCVLIIASLYSRNIDEKSTASIAEQPLSITVINSIDHLRSIRVLRNDCGLNNVTDKPIVVDHMTYFEFRNSSYPMHVLYVSNFFGGDLADGKLLPFLKSRGVVGVITRCEWMPKEISGFKFSNNLGYCCVSLQ
jgi:hypothetical protein